MGSGLIFAILLVMWLAYLIPWFASRRQHSVDQADEVEDRFAHSMTIIRRSADPFSADPFSLEPNPDLEVSTPLTRAAARFEVRQLNRLAARRRRRVVLVLLVAALATAALAITDPLPVVHVPVWAPVIPVGLLLAFGAVARFSVVALNRTLAARVVRIESGWEEDTISFEVPAELRDDASSSEHSIELSSPVVGAGSLWDPIPVTAPTYVSKPMVPRTIRTIDLAMPEPSRPDPVPVVAEAPGDQVPSVEATLSVEAVRDEDLPRAVGE